MGPAREGLSGDSLGTPGRIEEAITEPRLAKFWCGREKKTTTQHQFTVGGLHRESTGLGVYCPYTALGADP